MFRALETTKNLCPVEIPIPTLNNVITNFKTNAWTIVNNSFDLIKSPIIFSSLLIKVVGGNELANWVCFKHNDVSYGIQCAKLLGGRDLQGNLLALLNKTCEIAFTSQEDCRFYSNYYLDFGKTAFGYDLCYLSVPKTNPKLPDMTPPSCIIDTLQKNMPSGIVTSDDLTNTIGLSVVGGVIAIVSTGLGLFSIHNYLKNKNNATDESLDKEISLAPKAN